MQLSTKNFFLYLLTVAFLVIGIVGLLAGDMSVSRQSASLLEANPNQVTEYGVSTSGSRSVDRLGNQVSLRGKIAALGLAESEPDPQPEIISVPAEAEADDVSNLECASPSPYNGVWREQGLHFAVAEGARLLYREYATTSLPVGSSTTLTTTMVKEVLLQLPLNTNPQSPHCLNSDVIGIALDGSLIRNNEHTLYSVFGGDTHIGYALDGFPIYGRTAVPERDACGGALVDGSYRYFVASDGPAIINCFSALPVEI